MSQPNLTMADFKNIEAHAAYLELLQAQQQLESELEAAKAQVDAPEDLATLRAEVERLNHEIEELRKQQPQEDARMSFSSQLSKDPEDLNLAQLKAEIKRLEVLKAEEEAKIPVTYRSIAGEIGNMLLKIPAELASGLRYVVNPNNAGRIYSGWVGKFGALALFSAFASNVLPKVLAYSPYISAVVTFLARAAFPQLSVAADILQFMATSEFMFASLVTASDLFDKGFNGENGKIYGKDLAKDFVKRLLPHDKTPATGYSPKDWRQWLFAKITDFAGAVGGSLGTAYGLGLAVMGSKFATTFLARLPVVGPIAAIAAGVTAVVANLGMIAFGSLIGGVMLFGSKEFVDFIGGIGSTAGQQQWANVTGAAYALGARAANVTGMDRRYEGAKETASNAYQSVASNVASVRDGASARYTSAKAMVFGRGTDATATAPVEEQRLGTSAQVENLDTSARNDESCIRSTMRAMCRI